MNMPRRVKTVLNRLTWAYYVLRSLQYYRKHRNNDRYRMVPFRVPVADLHPDHFPGEGEQDLRDLHQEHQTLE